jgi:hypothetical protein
MTPLKPLGVSPREMAQTLGTEFGRKLVNPDVWVMMTQEYLKAMQVWGMQSGETLEARQQPNGREHRIERVVVDGSPVFLVTFLDPAKREVLFDFVETSAVKSWRLA